jgi:serine/threonine protein kinase
VPENDTTHSVIADRSETPSLHDAWATPSVDRSTTTEKGTLSQSNFPPVSSNRYLLREVIAHGGMGVVYRATDTSFGREVALKVLKEKFAATSRAARRFADEARITGQLQHPAIPPAHEIGILPDGCPFLAMKLIRGRTLDELLDERPDQATDFGRFVAVFEQVCQAIAYAHANRVIHRDLKPTNVMVGTFGEVQVMDWGLAKVLQTGEQNDPTDPEEITSEREVHSLATLNQSLTQTGSVLGTPAFMPPEQAIGAIDKIDMRSDVFGLGAVLAVILSGKPPFIASSSESIRSKSAQGKVEDCFARLDASGAEPEWVALCKRCLAPEKANRPTDAGEVARAVAELRAEADERARRAELERVKANGERMIAETRAEEEIKTRRFAEEKSAEQRKRRRVQSALVVAIVLLLLGIGAFAWYSDRQSSERKLPN